MNMKIVKKENHYQSQQAFPNTEKHERKNIYIKPVYENCEEGKY